MNATISPIARAKLISPIAMRSTMLRTVARPVAAVTRPGEAPPPPLPEYEPTGTATVTVGEPAKPTPWLLYGGIAAGLGVVGYLVWRKTQRKGR